MRLNEEEQAFIFSIIESRRWAIRKEVKPPLVYERKLISDLKRKITSESSRNWSVRNLEGIIKANEEAISKMSLEIRDLKSRMSGATNEKIEMLQTSASNIRKIVSGQHEGRWDSVEKATKMRIAIACECAVMMSDDLPTEKEVTTQRRPSATKENANANTN